MIRNFTRGFAALGVAAAIVAAPQFLGAQVKPPPAGPLRPYAFPAINDFRLPNGLRVIVVEKHTLPIVTGRLMLDAGAMREPASKSGLAGIAGTLLAEGTGNLTGADIAKEMERIGAQFSTGGGYSTSFANVTALTDVFPQALGLAARTVTAPTFPEGEFTRVRNQAIAAYQQSHARTAGLAADAFNRAAFDSAAPFSRPPNGIPATLNTLTRADVVAWHQSMFAPSAATLLLVGDITPATARTVAQQAFGGWKATRAASAPVSNPVRSFNGT